MTRILARMARWLAHLADPSVSECRPCKGVLTDRRNVY